MSTSNKRTNELFDFVRRHGQWMAFIPVAVMVVFGMLTIPNTDETRVPPVSNFASAPPTAPPTNASAPTIAPAIVPGSSVVPTVVDISACPPAGLTQIPAQFDASSFTGSTFCGYRPAFETAALMVHGDHVWELSAMPAALRAYVLTWGLRVSRQFDVPLWAILAVWRSELMGQPGFSPLETQISVSCAVGPGQITGPYWDGTDYPREVWRSCKPFETNPQAILANGCGMDFDGDGYANPLAIADNMAGTACGLRNSGVTNANCSSASQCQGILSEALFRYLGDRNTVYAGYGVAWAVSVSNDANLVSSANCTIDGDQVSCS